MQGAGIEPETFTCLTIRNHCAVVAREELVDEGLNRSGVECVLEEPVSPIGVSSSSST